MKVKEEIKKILEEAVEKTYHDFNGRDNHGTIVSVEKPKDLAHGDYSTSVALALAKKLGKNPLEVAQKIAQGISDGLIRTNKRIVGRVEVVAPGFVNFYLSDEVFGENLKQVLKLGANFGRNNRLKNEKIIVEYTDPNILKEFHIGHLMSNAIGESISRVLEAVGGKVKRACYQGDVGMHIAKAVWGKMRQMEKSWQEGYVLGSEKYETDETAKSEIVTLNKKIFERSDKAVNKLYDEGKKWSLAYFETIYKKLGTKFDYYFFESQVAGIGTKIVLDNVGKVFEKGENGAIIFKGENVGLHTRVFVNSEGLPTYEAKDLALPLVKYKKYAYGKSVIITASEQNEYFKVMLCALGKINPQLAQKTTHIGHGMLRLPEGKMSSRTGKVITAESLLVKLEELVMEKIGERELSEKEKVEISQKVAVGALKYSVLKQAIGGDIIYDVEKSISFQGDSGPYLQYSLARANSVLEKGKKERIKCDANMRMHTNNTNIETNGLEKMMLYFPEVVEKAGREFEPHGIVLYLTELASAFNGYYGQNKIVDKADEFSPYKLAITRAFTVIMKNGLWLLGIPVPEKM